MDYGFWKIFYNLVSPVYDVFFGSNTPRVRDMRRRIVNRLELRKGYSVLEIAVGTGANLPFIKEKIGPSGKIFGIDISQGMLKKCREKIQKEKINAEIKLGNAERLPYKDGSFDAVLNFGAMNFYKDKEKVMTEMIRTAKPGAKIVIGDELFPFSRTHLKFMEGLPEKASEPKLSFEKALLSFWIMEFRKRKDK